MELSLETSGALMVLGNPQKIPDVVFKDIVQVTFLVLLGSRDESDIFGMRFFFGFNTFYVQLNGFF